MTFWTNPLGSNSFTERVRLINSTGNFLIGTITDAGYKLDVNGTARTGALTLTGSLLPRANPTSGTWTGSGTIPRGIYNVSLEITTAPSGISIYQNGKTIMKRVKSTEVQEDNQYGGTIVSDGTNTTYSCGDNTIYWYKF